MEQYTLRLDWGSDRLRTVIEVLGRGPDWVGSAAGGLAAYLVPWDDYYGPQRLKLEWRPDVIRDVCDVLGSEATKLEIKLETINQVLDEEERLLQSQAILEVLAEIYAALRDISTYRHTATLARLTPLRSGTEPAPGARQDPPRITTDDKHQ